jgi:16S rRNA (guanine966-N2)-methyltransferase
MRVIAGTYRSRPLQAPPGLETRPTSDRLRETLFNVLGARIPGSRFVDLYAGSGAVGIEAISRGAEHVWFAENAPQALQAIRKNLSSLKIAGGFAIEDRSATRLLSSLAKAGRAVDVVFFDPPYEAVEEYSNTLHLLAREHEALLRPGAVVVVEHQKKKPLAETYGKLERTRVLTQGDVALSFYAVAEATVTE